MDTVWQNRLTSLVKSLPWASVFIGAIDILLVLFAPGIQLFPVFNV